MRSPCKKRLCLLQIRASNGTMHGMTLFPSLSADVRALVDSIPYLVDRIFPLPGQFRRALPHDIAELSHMLTNNRGSRTASYLGKPALLSAYLRYFLPWNVYRLCRLFPSLPLRLRPDDMIVDLGSGPLTFVIALWIAKPELRAMPLEFRCIDHTQAVLAAGKKVFLALAGADSVWTIKAIKGDIHAPVYGKRPALSAAVNVFNETYQNLPHTVSLEHEADKIGRRLAVLAPQALVVEPGVPRSGEFIVSLRNALIRAGFVPQSPCPQSGACALAPHIEAFGGAYSGAKAKWCHFAFPTLDAPEALLKLSADSGLPKERAVLSFLFAAAGAVKAEHEAATLHASATLQARVLSDAFPLPPLAMGRKPLAGRYACSEKGLVLVRGGEGAIERLSAGTLVSFHVPKPEKRDKKTNALLVDSAVT
ncbi:MAG: small ribosomal subunit Rsm22 family protein [Treponema sp.]|nr:small ribosomal subunit Rsm22 family protein [Treponema sp.]